MLCTTQELLSYCHDLFAPFQEERIYTVTPRGKLELVADYLNTTTGAWDLFRVFEHVFSYVKDAPGLSYSTRQLASKISGLIALSGISLSIPVIFVEANRLRKKVDGFVAAQEIPYSDSLRHQKILQSGKAITVSGLSLTNSLSQAVLFLHEGKVVNLKNYLPAVDSVYQTTALITDGVELIEEVYNLNAYPTDRLLTQYAAREVEERRRISWMVIAKNLASVALATFALVGLAFGVGPLATGAVSPAILLLSTVWLVMKISSYFYKQIVEERYGSSMWRLA